jgi:hypothetical protein
MIAEPLRSFPPSSLSSTLSSGTSVSLTTLLGVHLFVLLLVGVQRANFAFGRFQAAFFESPLRIELSLVCRLLPSQPMHLVSSLKVIYA